MAGKKNFTKMNPNEKLAGTTTPKNTEYKNGTLAAIEPKPQESEPKQKSTQQNESKSTRKKGQKYLSLDITDYKNYISLMAEHLSNTSGKYVSMTQYILRLIEADKQANIELFQKLEQIESMKRELI